MGVSLRSGSFPTLAETVLVSCQGLDILWEREALSLGSKNLQVHELEVVKCVWGKRDKEAETAACA